MKKNYKVLFYIKGVKPDSAELKEAEKINGDVVFRNASLVPEVVSEGSLRPCDAVAGLVPEQILKFKNLFKVIPTKLKTKAELVDEAKKAAKNGETPSWNSNN